MKLICSWKTLFQYAGQLGQARLRYSAEPTEANAAAVKEAEARHDDYRDMCLKADEMIHFPDISPATLRATRV